MSLVARVTETDLPVDAARRGSPEAWDALLRRYQLPLFTYIMDLVHHHATALDLVQDSFIRATRHLNGLRDNARFGSWLFTIAHQQVIQYWRRRGRSPFSDEVIPEDTPDTGTAPDLEAIREEDASRLLLAIDHLPTAQRSVILLHFLEDFPLVEIAAITGASLGTVKSRLHYAKRALRQILDRESPERIP